MLTSLLVYSFFIIVIAWIGGAIPIYFRKNSFVIHLFISFGAGVLLGAALLHMTPDAAKYIGPRLGLPILLGFLSLYIFEKFIMTHPCPSEGCEFHSVGISAFVGLSVHSLITGLALGAGIFVPHLGMVVFLAVVLHKLPASLSLSSLLIKEHYSNKSIMLLTLLFSVMVPIGAFITFFVLQGTSLIAIGYLIAFSAGTFLHVAADDLIPEVHRHFQYRYVRLVAFLSGLVVIGVVRFLA
ncbi:MAG: ZIP family metal transporter [Calditrichaeota bacterium]|nr:ZIP family metal transporter [Calditrichota bacterium]